MPTHDPWTPRPRSERGQATLLILGALAAVLAGTLFLVALGQAPGARGKHQRAADLAAVSAARVMADAHPRLFEPPVLEHGVPNPRHLPLPAYLARARRTAIRAAGANGVRLRIADVRFPPGFAPTRVTVITRGAPRVRMKPRRRGRARVPVRARATAELAPAAGSPAAPGHATGGGYRGPLSWRQGKPSPYLFSAL